MLLCTEYGWRKTSGPESKWQFGTRILLAGWSRFATHYIQNRRKFSCSSQWWGKLNARFLLSILTVSTYVQVTSLTNKIIRKNFVFLLNTKELTNNVMIMWGIYLIICTPFTYIKPKHVYNACTQNFVVISTSETYVNAYFFSDNGRKTWQKYKFEPNNICINIWIHNIIRITHCYLLITIWINIKLYDIVY